MRAFPFQYEGLAIVQRPVTDRSLGVERWLYAHPQTVTCPSSDGYMPIYKRKEHAQYNTSPRLFLF